jgi:hypothetical protein
MVQFWLDNITSLISTDNLNFNDISQSQKQIQILNLIALVALTVGLVLSFRKKKVFYFGGAIIIMAFTILIKSNTNSSFTNTSLDSAWDTGAFLTRNVSKNDPSGINNKLYVNQASNFNKGDIIALSNNNEILETNIISDVKYTLEDNTPVLVLINNLNGTYPKYTTKILKVSDAAPESISPPDGNLSIQLAGGGSSDPMVMATQNYPKFNLPNQNRFDWNLEQSSMIPGTKPTYEYQGQPYGNLKCRGSTIDNPMGTINVTEYDAAPTMYGTCNVAEMTDGKYNDTLMTENQEATLSQSVNDLLFHKGNSQMLFSPMPVDTLPDNRAAFANFCYNSPANMINVKYGSIFVNDPEKMKLVTSLSKATGTENGG